MKSFRTVVLALGVMLGASVVHAQDWTQWRGPSRDGTIPAASVPKEWPEKYQAAWRVELGEGYSSPVVAGGAVFVHSRKDPQEIVTAVDLQSGKILWQKQYDAPFQKNQYARGRAKGPHATPLVSGRIVFTLGVTGILTAWDAVTGRVLWRNNYSGMTDTSKLFCGAAASPLLWGDHLIVQLGSDIHGGQILALDLATGRARWTWKGAGPGYASPVTVELSGSQQVITMTQGSIVGLDARDGKELWSVAFPDEWNENIVTPIWTGKHLIVSGPRQGTHAYTLVHTGEKWNAIEVWYNKEIAFYMSTPVHGDGLLYGLASRRKGQFVALNAETGALKWATEGREGEHASALLAPQHVVLLTNAGGLIILNRNAEKFDVVRRVTVADSETWAVPVLLRADLLVRDAGGLKRLTPMQ